jgi:hypothetical protein
MSLRCSSKTCLEIEIARGDQLEFVEDSSNGWNLCFPPKFVIAQESFPSTVRLVEMGCDNQKRGPKITEIVVCNRCDKKVASVSKIPGLKKPTVNFSAKKVVLLMPSDDFATAVPCHKWSKMIEKFPEIRRTSYNTKPIDFPTDSNTDTVHFNGDSDFQELVKAGTDMASRLKLTITDFQWRSFFFSCMNDTMLCLPSGMGKTFVASMVMKAYYQKNPTKGQVYVVSSNAQVKSKVLTDKSNIK